MLPIPVWTGNSGERWGAVEVRTGTGGNVVCLLSLLTHFVFWEIALLIIIPSVAFPPLNEQKVCLA